MNQIFSAEKDLVNFFIKNYNKTDKELIVEEMPIRFGNIDIVSIKNSVLSFSEKQIAALSKPANAQIFTKTKCERPLSKETMVKTIGLSESTINKSIYELINNDLIIKKKNNYFRKSKFVFPKTTVTGFEAKLKDFSKAFYQAKLNLEYVDYSYLVFPSHIAENIVRNKSDLLTNNGIGLIAVDREKNEILLNAKKVNKMCDYLRLLSISKAHMMQVS
jgi:biotin operon repressor